MPSPAPLVPVSIDSYENELTAPAAIAYDAVTKKAYVGTRSSDSKRQSLLVFDVGPDNAVKGKPRSYSDHPTPLDVNWSCINCLLLSSRFHKLFLGVEDVARKTQKTLVVYDLDAAGEPVGAPRAYEGAIPELLTLTLHPKLNRLYLSGWGVTGYSTIDLDAKGEPVSSAVLHQAGGNGKYSLRIRADGSKIYLGTFPTALEAGDLDAEGNLEGTLRSYPVPNAPAGYLTMTANAHGVYFQTKDGFLGYTALDNKGEPSGDFRTDTNWPIQSVAAASNADNLLVARDINFKDAVNGKIIPDGFNLQEIATGADGVPGKVVASAATQQATATVLGGMPSAAVTTSPFPAIFRGNRFAGLRMRATITGIKSNDDLLPMTDEVTLGQVGYLCFTYSAAHSMVYAVAENSLLAYSLKTGPGTKAITVDCPNINNATVTKAVVVDDAAGLLYAARKDGSVAVRKLDAGGVPAATGEELVTGIKSIYALCLNPKTHHLYVLGMPSGETPTDKRIVPVASPLAHYDAAIDAERGRLYSCTANAPQNIWVWQLAPDGRLAEPQPRAYDEKLPDEAARPGQLSAVRLDLKRRKLYVCGNPAKARPGEGAIIVYDLDDSGDPKGTPRIFQSGNKTGAAWNLELSPNGNWLYEGGYGDGAIYAHRLDAAGEPVGKPQAWPTGAFGKMLLVAVPDGSRLLSGSFPASLEVVHLQKDGTAEKGVQADFTLEKQKVNFGVLGEGGVTPWVNLDSSLQDGVGQAHGYLALSGGTLQAATVKFEVALGDGAEDKPLKTLTSELAGNTAAFFVPRYGISDMKDVPGMVQNSADYYRQFLTLAQKSALKPEEQPQNFIIGNTLWSVDSSLAALDTGLATLQLMGHNTAALLNFDGAPSVIHDAAARHGIDKFTSGIYNPPSYFDYRTEQVKPEFLDKWAGALTKAAASMGAKPAEIKLYHFADEPGWYFPQVYDDIESKPEWLAVFRDYLKGKGLAPADIGKNSWDEVKPGRWTKELLQPDAPLPARRLMFWTQRFVVESASRGFAAASKAIQRQSSSQTLTATNFGNKTGRSFTPSPNAKIANNWDTGPSAGLGAPDWFDVSRKKGETCLWTEDWFGNDNSQEWSMEIALLRSAARESGADFGAYTVGFGLANGLPGEGGKYKVMLLAGQGAKAIMPYVFGPDAATGDAWAGDRYTYPQLAAGMRMLGKSEKLTFSGRPRSGTVAILFPQASQIWDPDAGARYYSNELFGLHAALVHEGYPVDFVDDFGVEAGELTKYKYSVLYVTAPNLSRKAQTEILQWVRNGGTVVLSPGACSADELNEPTDLLWKASGATRAAVPRETLPLLSAVQNGKPTTIVPLDDRLGTAKAATLFQTAPLTPTDGKALANFDSGGAAIVAASTGAGRVVSMGFWPGVSYWNSPRREDKSVLPQNWSAPLRRIITSGAHFSAAGKYAVVSTEGVESELLESDKGQAITLFNWSGQPLKEITVTIPVAGKFSKVESVEQGALSYTTTPAGLKVQLPLKSVDVLMLTR